MKIALLQIGKTTDKYIISGVADYSVRICKYVGFEIITAPELKNTKSMPFSEQKQREGERIIKSITKDDWVILLDERGTEFSTTEFAGQLSKIFMMPKKRVVFIIGGPYGFSKEVYDRADQKLSLSRMTFSHQLVRLLFAEQLYRILTVIKGDPYHHD